MNIETANYHEIVSLNQRGGRTLSVVDLIKANTLDVALASYLGSTIAAGASFLTLAHPGGAGKTTVMAALLGFLPTSVPIISVASPQVIDEAATNGQRSCYLAHEIGTFDYYGYIWGDAVKQYFDLIPKGHIIASGLHADNIEAFYQITASPQLNVPEVTLQHIDLLIFMALDRQSAGDFRRRVSSVYRANNETGKHELTYRWNPNNDSFHRENDILSGDKAENIAITLDKLIADDISDFRKIRSTFIDEGLL